MLEAFVTEAAVELLTHLDVTGAPSVATALSAQDEATIAADEHELAELNDMWNSRELSTREYRQMRKTVYRGVWGDTRSTVSTPASGGSHWRTRRAKAPDCYLAVVSV